MGVWARDFSTWARAWDQEGEPEPAEFGPGGGGNRAAEEGGLSPQSLVLPTPSLLAQFPLKPFYQSPDALNLLYTGKDGPRWGFKWRIGSHRWECHQ